MKRWAELYAAIDAARGTDAKVALMSAHFTDLIAAGRADDAAWGVFVLSGRRLTRVLSTRLLSSWAMEVAQVPEWLMRESYAAVGDTAETASLLVCGAGDAAEVGALVRTLLGSSTGDATVRTDHPDRPAQRQQLDLFANTPDPPAASEAPGGVADDPAARGLSWWMVRRIEALRGLDEAQQRRRVLSWWLEVVEAEAATGDAALVLLVLNKLMTGALRVGVSQGLVVRALATAFGLEPGLVSHRMMGEWQPTAVWFERLVRRNAPDDQQAAGVQRAGEGDALRPYPFYLASPLGAGDTGEIGADPQAELELLKRDFGNVGEWLAEWKWDGIRAQLIRRFVGDHPVTLLWSRGDENLTERFPEVIEAAESLPVGVVLDGELMAWTDGGDRVAAAGGLRDRLGEWRGGPMPFAALQTRIGRTNVTARALREAPVVFMAYDLMEAGGVDVRDRPLMERRAMLEGILSEGRGSGVRGSGVRGSGVRGSGVRVLGGDVAAGRVRLSPAVTGATWDELLGVQRSAREHGTEGLMLKRLSGVYRAGRVRGDWWKWKIEPLTIDAVLMYAQPGSGRRASLLTDYTFGVWAESGGGRELTPVAKAYSGLSQAEIDELDAWIRRHTVERFGPVRSVEAQHVFEIAFDSVQGSDRHRSGLAVRFPRIRRWRKDKTIDEADTLDELRRLMR